LEECDINLLEEGTEALHKVSDVETYFVLGEVLVEGINELL